MECSEWTQGYCRWGNQCERPHWPRLRTIPKLWLSVPLRVPEPTLAELVRHLFYGQPEFANFGFLGVMETTGVTVRIIGQGASFESYGEESDLPLHVLLSGSHPGAFIAAVAKLYDVLHTSGFYHSDANREIDSELLLYRTATIAQVARQYMPLSWITLIGTGNPRSGFWRPVR